MKKATRLSVILLIQAVLLLTMAFAVPLLLPLLAILILPFLTIVGRRFTVFTPLGVLAVYALCCTFLNYNPLNNVLIPVMTAAYLALHFSARTLDYKIGFAAVAAVTVLCVFGASFVTMGVKKMPLPDIAAEYVSQATNDFLLVEKAKSLVKLENEEIEAEAEKIDISKIRVSKLEEASQETLYALDRLGKDLRLDLRETLFQVLLEQSVLTAMAAYFLFYLLCIPTQAQCKKVKKTPMPRSAGGVPILDKNGKTRLEYMQFPRIYGLAIILPLLLLYLMLRASPAAGIFEGLFFGLCAVPAAFGGFAFVWYMLDLIPIAPLRTVLRVLTAILAASCLLFDLPLLLLGVIGIADIIADFRGILERLLA